MYKPSLLPPPAMFIVPLNGTLKFSQWLKCLVCRANLWLTQHWPQSNRLGVGRGRVLRRRKSCNTGPCLSTFSCLLYKSTNRWWYMLGGTLLCPIGCNHVHKLLCRWNLCNAPASCHRLLGTNNWLFCIAIDLRLRRTRGWLLCHWGTKLQRSVPQRQRLRRRRAECFVVVAVVFLFCGGNRHLALNWGCRCIAWKSTFCVQNAHEETGNTNVNTTWTVTVVCRVSLFCTTTIKFLKSPCFP